jgi:hypothetical protein
VKTRQWKPSLPALSLAVALHDYCRVREFDGLHIEDLFVDADLAWRLCKNAALLNRVVSQKFDIKQYVQIILKD